VRDVIYITENEAVDSCPRYFRDNPRPGVRIHVINTSERPQRMSFIRFGRNIRVINPPSFKPPLVRSDSTLALSKSDSRLNYRLLSSSPLGLLARVVNWLLLPTCVSLVCAIAIRRRLKVVIGNEAEGALIGALLARVLSKEFILVAADPYELRTQGILNSYLTMLRRLTAAMKRPSAIVINPENHGRPGRLESFFGCSHVVITFDNLTVQQYITSTERRSSNGRIKVLYAGSMSFPHRMDVLLEAARIAHGANDSLEFTLVGGGSAPVSAAAASLPFVRVRDRVGPEEAAQLMMDSDICVEVNTDVGMSTKVPEYILAGKPVVIACGLWRTTRLPGCVVIPPDAEVLARTILEVAADPAREKRMVAEARAAYAEDRKSRENLPEALSEMIA